MVNRNGLLTGAFILLVSPCRAQQVVAPSPEKVGSPRGEDVNGYNVVNSFETGYRFHTVGGNLGKYRSDVNFGNGVRLLGSNLGVYSKDGHGRLFDELVLTTQGLGNDPYQYSSVRLQKNRLYRYDLLWRLNDYFNPGLTIANGEHLLNTTRRLQDHDFTLLPQSNYRLFLGYSRNSQDGPALSTIQLFSNRGDEFPLFAGIRRVQNEYRLGGEFRVFGIKLNVLRGWTNFKEDTKYLLQSPSAGNNPNDLTDLTSFSRNEPYHGNTPYWRANLFTERGSWLALNGRFTYAGGRRSFVLDESAIGTDRLGLARDRQTLVFGTGSRPVSAGNLTLSLFPTSKVTITNHTAFHNIRMGGDGVFQEFNNATGGSDLLQFQFLGIRVISTATDVHYRPSRWLGLYGGYQYSTRRIRSREEASVQGVTGGVVAGQENRIHSGLTGFRLQPWKPLTINLDAEIGRADRPFFPVSDRNYHGLGARVQYKAGSLLLSAAARSFYNTNSVSLSSHSSRSRNYAVDASWAPSRWFAFDAGYSKIHLDTVSGLAYFAVFQLIDSDRSLYISNVHSGTLGVRIGLGKRADFYAGYSRVQDTGDGRSIPSQPPPGGVPGSQFAAFRSAQTFPLAYQSPLARLSIRLHSKIRWNVGYQYYDYREDFQSFQNYRAHTGYSSVVWSF
jgi:hypothetical protein